MRRGKRRRREKMGRLERRRRMGRVEGSKGGGGLEGERGAGGKASRGEKEENGEEQEAFQVAPLLGKLRDTAMLC